VVTVCADGPHAPNTPWVSEGQLTGPETAKSYRTDSNRDNLTLTLPRIPVSFSFKITAVKPVRTFSKSHHQQNAFQFLPRSSSAPSILIYSH
jgi:hypothetical protein